MADTKRTHVDPASDERIVVDEATRFGKPIIRGTRVAVDEILGLLSSGMSEEDVADEFDIEIEDIHAALPNLNS